MGKCLDRNNLSLWKLDHVEVARNVTIIDEANAVGRQVAANGVIGRPRAVASKKPLMIAASLPLVKASSEYFL